MSTGGIVQNTLFVQACPIGNFPILDPVIYHYLMPPAGDASDTRVRTGGPAQPDAEISFRSARAAA